MSAAPRSTGWTPPLAASPADDGQANSSFLPSQWIRRRSAGVSHEPMTTASAFEAWLAARMTGPARGMCSRPSMWTLVNVRAMIRGAECHHPDEHRLVVVEAHGDARGCRSASRALGVALAPARARARWPRASIVRRLGRHGGRGRRCCNGLRRLGRGRGGSRADRRSTLRIAPTTVSTVCSNVLPSVSMITASSAARSGATARLRSSASRSRSWARTASASSPVGSRPALLDPTRRPLLDRGVEEQLEVGVGQHDRPDVAAGHDDPAAVGERALTRQERGAQLGLARDRRDGGIDVGAPRGLGRVGAIDEDRRQAARAVVRELDLVDERDEAVRVVRRDARAQRQRP